MDFGQLGFNLNGKVLQYLDVVKKEIILVVLFKSIIFSFACINLFMSEDFPFLFIF